MMGINDVTFGVAIEMGPVGSTSGPFSASAMGELFIEKMYSLQQNEPPRGPWSAHDSMSWFPVQSAPAPGFKFVPIDCEHCDCVRPVDAIDHVMCCNCGRLRYRSRHNGLLGYGWDHSAFGDD